MDPKLFLIIKSGGYRSLYALYGTSATIKGIERKEMKTPKAFLYCG
jgi:hypothetical protein